jgi:sugar phosphate permease
MGRSLEPSVVATAARAPSVFRTLASRTAPCPSGALAWFTWTLVAVGYALAFLQRLAPATVVDKLMGDFGVGASQIGLLSSAYFYGYMLMQVPASLVVDRFGVRRATVPSLLVSATATLMFAHAPTASVAVGARILVAAGDAFVWSALIKLVTQWFPATRFGLMSGLSQLSGFVGGLFATTPFAILVSVLGWRRALESLAYVILALFVLALVALRDHPGSLAAPAPNLRSLLADTGRVLRRAEAWGPTLTFIGAYVVSLSLSGVWGVPFLMQVYGLPAAAASVPMLAFMLGFAAGSLAFGFLADSHFRSPRLPLLVMGVARVALVLLIAPLVGGYLSATTIVTVMALLGVLGGGTVPLTLICVRRLFTAANISTAIGINLTMANLANALAQPALGAMLDHFWTGTWAAPGVRLYTPAGYTGLLLCLAVISVLAVVGPLLLERPKTPAVH